MTDDRRTADGDADPTPPEPAVTDGGGPADADDPAERDDRSRVDADESPDSDGSPDSHNSDGDAWTDGTGQSDPLHPSGRTGRIRPADSDTGGDSGGVSGGESGGDYVEDLVDDDRHPALQKALAVARLTRRADATFVAGSLAYYSIVASLPIAVLVVTLAVEVGNESFARQAAAAGGELLTPRGREFVYAAMNDVAHRQGILVVSGVLVAFSVVQLFRGLDRAFATVYGGVKRGVLSGFREVGFAFLIGGLGVSAVVLAAGALSLYANESLVRLAIPATVFGLSSVALFPLFYALPGAEVGRREVLPGTLFAAAGWTVAGAMFGWYASGTRTVGIYGALGGLIVLVTWFYAANLLILVGAAVNVVFAGRE